MTRIRPAAPVDADAIARVYVESWRSTYAGLLPASVLLRRDAVARQSRWWRDAIGRGPADQAVRVAEHPAAGVVGVAGGGAARCGALGYRGEVYTLYLLDDHQGKGLGKRLFVDLCESLSRRHGRSVMVWVLDGNPARFFYRSLGGRFVARRAGRMGGARIEELAYGWDDVRELTALGRSSEAR